MTKEERARKIAAIYYFCNMQDHCSQCVIGDYTEDCGFCAKSEEKINELCGIISAFKARKDHEKEPEKIQYAWNAKGYGYGWAGEYDSVKECIEDAKQTDNLKSGDTILIGKAQKAKINAGMFMNEVLEEITNYIVGEFGECADGWNIVNEEGREEILDRYKQRMTDLFNEYIKEIKQEPKFYDVTDVHRVVIE